MGRPGLVAGVDRRRRPERVAAFFCEPVIGAGGVFPPPEGYLEAVRQVCRDTGVLFVADEVITGFGRCGDWFASSRFALDPDIVVCAKGVTSGYLPLGAVLASPGVAAAFWAEGAGMWRHGYTYSGHAAVAAAALVNIDILGARARGAAGLRRPEPRMEGSPLDALKQLSDHDLVDDVRGGVGLLGAVALRPDVVEAGSDIGDKGGPSKHAAPGSWRPPRRRSARREPPRSRPRRRSSRSSSTACAPPASTPPLCSVHDGRGRGRPHLPGVVHRVRVGVPTAPAEGTGGAWVNPRFGTHVGDSSRRPGTASPRTGSGTSTGSVRPHADSLGIRGEFERSLVGPRTGQFQYSPRHARPFTSVDIGPATTASS